VSTASACPDRTLARHDDRVGNELLLSGDWWIRSSGTVLALLSLSSISWRLLRDAVQSEATISMAANHSIRGNEQHRKRCSRSKTYRVEVPTPRHAWSRVRRCQLRHRARAK